MNLTVKTLAILMMAGMLGATLTAQTPPGERDKLRNLDIENIGIREINKGSPNFTSLQNEAALGRKAAEEFERGTTLVDIPEVNDYVNRLAQTINRNSDSKFPVTIKVLKSDTFNSFSLPGGYVYVSSGLIRGVDNEAELAFAISYAVADVAARHITENQTKGNILQIALVPAIIQSGGVLSSAVQGANQQQLPVTMFQFSRSSVNESDFLGLQYLYKSGYEPQAAVTFLKKVEAAEDRSQQPSALLNTHPPAKDRIKSTQKNIEAVLPSRANNVLNTPEFDAVKIRLAQ